MELCQATCNLSGPINYLEFGVYQGHSIKWWVKENTDPASRFVGFDSFQGLPEDWTSENRAGHFSTQGRIPEVAYRAAASRSAISTKRFRISFGVFRFTRNSWSISTPTSTAQRFASSRLLQPYLKPGDILIFDEFSDSCHEFRAFSDFISAFGLEYVPIANLTKSASGSCRSPELDREVGATGHPDDSRSPLGMQSTAPIPRVPPFLARGVMRENGLGLGFCSPSTCFSDCAGRRRLCLLYGRFAIRSDPVVDP